MVAIGSRQARTLSAGNAYAPPRRGAGNPPPTGAAPVPTRRCRCRFVRTTDLAQRLQAARRELALWPPSASSITLRSRGSSATTARCRSATALEPRSHVKWLDSVARHAKFLVTCKPASAGGIRLARQGCRTLRASRRSGAPAARSGTATRHGGRRFPVPIGGGGMGADPDHSLDEDRFILLGVTGRDRLVVVAHTLRSDTIRRINAADAADAA